MRNHPAPCNWPGVPDVLAEPCLGRWRLLLARLGITHSLPQMTLIWHAHIAAIGPKACRGCCYLLKRAHQSQRAASPTRGELRQALRATEMGWLPSPLAVLRPPGHVVGLKRWCAGIIKWAVLPSEFAAGRQSSSISTTRAAGSSSGPAKMPGPARAQRPGATLLSDQAYQFNGFG